MGLGLTLVNAELVTPVHRCDTALQLSGSPETWAETAHGAASPADALVALRFGTRATPGGDLDVVTCNAEKSGGERCLLEALARFVRPGSTTVTGWR